MAGLLARAIVMLACLWTSTIAADDFIFSTIPPVENGGTALIARTENETDIKIFCRVTNNGSQFDTTWFLQRFGQTRNLIFFPETNFVLVGVSSNLTIETLSRDLDRAILECTNGAGPGSPILEHAFFEFRIIEPPLLRRETVQVVENTMQSLNIELSAGFPVVPSYQWFFNGVPISIEGSINPNVSLYPQIVFSSVQRSHSGNYSISASTEGGNSTGYLILDVLAPPEGIQASNEMFAVQGTDTTITAFTNVTGNPTPNSIWTRNGSPLLSGMMYGTDSTGVLMISNVMLADGGNYTNTLHNMFNNQSFTNNHTITLQILRPASAPQNLSIANITSSAVVLRWLNPINSGVPAFVRFSIELTSTSKDIARSTAAVNNVDSSFSNTLTVTGLEPNTNYTVSIRAVSTHSAVGELQSDSITQVATTNVSVPQFELTIVENIDGMLEVRWTFLHTGGQPLHFISVMCSGSSSRQLCNTSLCTLTSACGDGSTRLGPVEAGNSYTCTVTASNAVGDTASNTSTVKAFTGIPSTPRISPATTGQLLMVMLRATADYAGVTTVDTSLYFNISVYNSTREFLLFNIILIPSADDFSGTSVTLSHVVSLSQSDTYLFIATAVNRYGSSLESEQAIITFLDSGELVPIIAGVSVVSVVIVIIAVSVLVIVTVCCLTDKKKKQAIKSNPVALQHIKSLPNESYGVLGGGVPQSIVLEDNNAYTAVKAVAASQTAIETNCNVAYGRTANTNDSSYDDVSHYYY